MFDGTTRNTSSTPRSGYHAASDDFEESATDGSGSLAFLGGLYRRRWLALGVWVLVTGGVSGVLFTRPPVFQASTRIEIGARQDIASPFKEQRPDTPRDALSGERQILTSRQLARQTVQALKLWEYEEFSPVNSRAPMAAAAASSDPSAGAVLSPLVSLFLSRVTIDQIQDTNIVDVHFQASDANLAAKAVNELAKQFVSTEQNQHSQSSKDVSDWLSKQLEEQRLKVEASENALQQFKEQRNVVAVEGDRQNIVTQKLSDLNAALTRAKTERLAKEAVVRQVEAVQTKRASVDSVPLIAGNPLLQQLRTQVNDLERRRVELSQVYGERHPEMIKAVGAVTTAQARFDAELQKAVEVIQNDYQAAVANEQGLTRALDEQKSEALSLNRQTIDYGALEREATSNREIYQALLQQAKQTGITSDVDAAGIRIIDPAEVPNRPIRPRPLQDAALAVLSGLCLSLALVASVEYFRRLRTPEDIGKFLRIPFLGLLPSFEKSAAPTGIVFGQLGTVGFSEGLRRVRSFLLLGARRNESHALLVTSSAPREGKSLISSNLAAALAAAGQSVVLVDADMRRATVHDTFGVDREPGLSNFLGAQLKLDQVLRRTSVDNLVVIPAGDRPTNPSELLGSDRLQQLIAELKGRFRWVIIDSPPVMAVADASLIAPHVSGVLFVVRADVTRIDVAKVAVGHLAQGRAVFAGAVLNDADIRHQPFVYARYHRDEYEAYYGQQ